MADGSFRSADQGREYPTLDDAVNAAVEAAAEIALGELRNGKDSICVEATAKNHEGTQVLRRIVSLSVAHLVLEDDREQAEVSQSTSGHSSGVPTLSVPANEQSPLPGLRLSCL